MLPALLIITLLVQSPSQPLSPRRGIASQTQQGHPQSTKQQPASNQRGTEESPIFIKAIPTPKTEAETAQEAEDRKEKSANDRKLVEFTGALVTATWTLAAIGVMQLFVFGYQAYQLWETVKGTAEQSEAMERSIAEATRLASAMEVVSKEIAISAKAATDSVAALKERTAQQMRAYLAVVVGAAIYQERNKRLKFEGKPLLVNSGHTPAYKVGYRAEAAILPIPLPKDFTFPLPDEVTGEAMLGSQQNATLSAVLDDFCDDAEVEDIKIGKDKCLYIWGIVTYEDIFGEARRTRFCQSLTWFPDGKVFGFFTPGHNDAT
jgi:hypothetical protein